MVPFQKKEAKWWVFFGGASYWPLLTSYLMQCTKKWETKSSYFEPQKYKLTKMKSEALLQDATS